MYKSTDTAVSGRDYPFVYSRVPEQTHGDLQMPKVDSVRFGRTKVSSPMNFQHPHLFGPKYDTVAQATRNPVHATSLKEQVSSVKMGAIQELKMLSQRRNRHMQG